MAKAILIRYQDKTYTKKGAVEPTPRHEYEFIVESEGGATSKSFAVKEPFKGIEAPKFGKFDTYDITTEVVTYFKNGQKGMFEALKSVQ